MLIDKLKGEWFETPEDRKRRQIREWARKHKKKKG